MLTSFASLRSIWGGDAAPPYHDASRRLLREKQKLPLNRNHAVDSQGAHAPSRVASGALAGRFTASARTKRLDWAHAYVFREGAEHGTRGRVRSPFGLHRSS